MVERISRILMAVSAACLALMTVVLCWQVIARYALGNSPAWAEQLALVLVIWSVFLGAAAGVGLGFHVRIAEGVEQMSARWAAVANRLAQVMGIALGVLLLIWGFQLVLATWDNAIPTLPFGRGVAYLVIPVSGLLITVFGVAQTAKGQQLTGEGGI